jgi:hypothetical protein
MIFSMGHTLLKKKPLIALLISIFILVPASAHAHSMDGLVVVVAAPIIVLIANIIKFFFLIIYNPAPILLFRNLLFATIWESILLLGMVIVAPTNINPNTNFPLLVRVIPWLIYFVVCAFFPNWLLIREKDEQFSLSSRKNIKILLLCLVTPAIILIIYVYLFIHSFF